MPPLDRSAAPAPAALTGPLRRLLRPVVRLLIRSGLTFPVLADLLRALYVEVAFDDLLAGSEPTVSRLSLMTGIHRKEVRRLRGPDADAAEPPMVTLATTIIGRWLAEHAGPDGAPLPLPRNTTDGPSFEALVRSATTDIRPRAVLDDWLAQNIITLDEADRVSLNEAAFLPAPGGAEQLFFFGRNLHDHAAAAAANLLAGGAAAPFLDRSAHYDGLTEATAARVEEVAREAARRMLIEVNRAALALMAENDQAVAAEPGQNLRRVNLGAYVFRDDDPGREAG